MNKFLKNKGVGYYLCAVTFILSLVTCGIYATAVAKVNSKAIIGLLIVGAALELVILIKPMDLFRYIPFILLLVNIVIFIPLAFDEVGDVLSKINMNGLSNSWIASAVLLLVTTVISGISTVCNLNKGEMIVLEENSGK